MKKLITFITSLLILTSCTKSVYHYELEAAEDICREKGGVFSLTIKSDTIVVCKDKYFQDINKLKGSYPSVITLRGNSE